MFRMIGFLVCLLLLTMGLVVPSVPAADRLLYLDGTGGYVELLSDIFNNYDEATVEGLVVWNSFKNWSRFFDFGNVKHTMVIANEGTSPTLAFYLYDQNGAPYYIKVPDLLQRGQWYHIAAVSGANGMKLYVDGQLVGTHSYTGSFSQTGSGDNNYLGRSSWGNDEYFHGYMDEVRVWSVARTQEEIQANMNQPIANPGLLPDLVGYWNFDDDTANDLSQYGNDGALQGDAAIVEADPARIILVPEHFPTIQAGIDAALNGNTVLVADGTYTGAGNVNLDFRGKAIIVKSEGGAESCVIDCENIEGTCGFYFHNGENLDSIVDGFTIQNGKTIEVFTWPYPVGGGIYCDRSSPTITNNIIKGNSGYYGGGGITCINSSSPMITNNTITGNSCKKGGGGGGIQCYIGSAAVIMNNIITENESVWGGGGISCLDNSPAKIVNNTIMGNVTKAGVGSGVGAISCRDSSATIMNNTIKGSIGNGIYSEDSSTLIDGNTIIDNSGMGIKCFGDSSPKIVGNIIRGNLGGGISCSSDSTIITANSIVGNASIGIYCSGDAKIINNIIANNRSQGPGGGISCSGGASPEIINNTIIGNEAVGEGGGILCTAGGSPRITNTILWNNSTQVYFGARGGTSAVTISYSDVQGGEAGIVTNDNGIVIWLNGNIDEDPMLTDVNSDDYHLSDSSPCIATGTMTPAVPDTDIEDNPRPDPALSNPDIGAYESSFIPTFALPEITTISPDKGGNTGFLTLTITGSGLAPNAEAKLTKSGEEDVIATQVTGLFSGTYLTAIFNLMEKAPGIWSIVITNPGGGSTTFPDAFTIESGGEPRLWVEIISRRQARLGRWNWLTIAFGNTGNVDGGAMLLISVSEGTEIKLPYSDIGNQTQIAAEYDDSAGLIVQVAQANMIGFFTATPIPSDGGVVYQEIAIRPNSSIPVTLSAELTALPQGLIEQSVAEFALPIVVEVFRENGYDLEELSALDVLLDVLVQVVKKVIDKALREFLRMPVLILFPELAHEICVGIVADLGVSFPDPDKIMSEKPPEIEAALEIKLGTGSEVIARDEIELQPVSSWDPNDKAGVDGFDPVGTPNDQRSYFVSAGKALEYMIFFENLAIATAAAQEVLIIDQLDASLDWSTFALSTVQIGEETVLVSNGAQNFATTVDLRPTIPTLVEVDCTFGTDTGRAEWLFRGRDPTTGELADFLPPNTEEVAPLGEGWVSYTVAQKPNLPTGTVIRNVATIDFEVDIPPAPMNTPEVFNTIDSGAPMSQVKSLPAEVSSMVFTVEWEGTDDENGCGIKDYTIYVSEDGSAYTEWLSNTTDTSAQFTGENEQTYYFYSRAEDNVGNVEEVPPEPPDATTTIQAPVPHWILTSIPLQLPDYSRDVVLESIVGHYMSIWMYDGVWHRYVVGGLPFLNDLTTIDPNRGYWIQKTDNTPLVVDGGVIDDAPISLELDWNLVSYKSLTAKPREEALASISDYYNSVWGYDGGQWERYVVGGLEYLNDLETMGPWKGYWIETISECEWDVNEPAPPGAPPLAKRHRRRNTPSNKPEIPYTIWGNIEADGVKMTGSGGRDGDRLAVILKIDGEVRSSYHLGAVNRYDDFYVMDISSPADSSALVELSVQVDGTVVKTVPVPSGKPGETRRFDLAIQLPPKTSLLHQNYPNPFNPETWIPYQLKEDAHVEIKIYAVTGRLVRILNLGHRPAGFYTGKEKAAYWDGRNEAGEHVASGVYFYSIESGALNSTRKMVVVR